MTNPKVFMDIEIAGELAGRIVFELFADTNPITAENFRALCTGEKGMGKSGKPLYYRRLPFDFVTQRSYGTDVGACGNEESIYGEDFPSENFVRKHEGPGFLSMTHREENCNNSMFFICTSEEKQLDGVCVVFGKVVDGMDVVYAIQDSEEEVNKKRVIIVDCGQLINMKNPKVFMDIEIAGTPTGRVVFELFADTNPITAENFRVLCTGEKGKGESGKPLHYKGLPFDIFTCKYYGTDVGVTGNEESIYGEYFPHENFVHKHAKPGVLSMTHKVVNRNNSSFFISTSAESQLDGVCVVFGKVVGGMDVVYAIQNSETQVYDRSVIIINCGQLKDTDFIEPY
ncbi:uncharacterized protein LOC141724276 [Apium graveolens]|uniref:uncharacterized protein LOC141724276 n=1 Tax=Apium graveolens TaxID=4045 RepID=UPI003D78BC26